MSKSKDDVFRKQLKENLDVEKRAANKVYKERMREIADAERADADRLAAISHTEQQTGKIVTLWEKAAGKADEALHSDVRAYDDWRAAMLGMLSMFGALHAALHQSANSVSRLLVEKFCDTVVVDWLWDGAIKRTWNRIKPTFGFAEEDLVALQHNVSFSDEHDKLVFKPLLRLDNDKPFIDKDPASGQVLPESKLDELFRAGITDWLKRHNYTPDPVKQEDFKGVNGYPLTFRDGAGKPLTKDAFNRLKEDPDNGLQHYLTGFTEAKLTPRM